MKNNIVALLLLVVLSFIPLVDLFYPGLPLTHDGQDHVARIANFYKNLEDGNIIPRWAPNLNWGFGHPILMFLYPLPSYAASLFHSMGFSLVDSTKLVFAFSYILSGITMFLWIRNIFGMYGGITASVLYLFAPYRFVDLYVRGAVGEHVAFIFGPLICYFLYKLSKKFNKWIIVGGVLSVSGLILSHNAVSIMFLPFITLYAVFLIYSSQNRRPLIYQYTSILVLGFGVSAFFVIPSFFEGKYTLRDIVTTNEYSSRFVEFRDLLYGQWSYGGSEELSKQIGIMHWFLIVVSLLPMYNFWIKKDISWIFPFVLFSIFILSIFFMMQVSEFIWKTFTTLQKFQFPWRFLTVSIFTSSILGGFVIQSMPQKYSRYLSVFIILLALFLNRDYWHVKGYAEKPESFYSGVYNGTTDTGESAPRWSIRFMEKRAENPIEIIGGDAQIELNRRTSTEHFYTVRADQRSRIKENTLYFPGWKVYVDGKDTNIEFQDQQHRGLITFFVEKGEHSVEIIFKETKLRMFANIVSLVSLVLLIYLITKPLYAKTS